MQRIHDVFARTRDSGGALIIYITAGDPSLGDTVEVALAAERGGADIIELGIPYSSPVADGPVIQEACRRALEGGATVRGVLSAAARVRERSEAPLVLMTAFNPVLIFGLDRFAAAASEAGVDGVLISDLPPSEAGAWSRAAADHGLGTVLLVAPDNTDEQMREALAMTTGFCYVVSRPGTTGARADLYAGLRELVGRAGGMASVPVAVGFGLSDADQVREVLAMADGAIVGSAIVRIIAEGNTDGSLSARVEEAVAALR